MSSENNIQNIQQWHPKKITNYTPFDELETRPIEHSCRLNLKVNTVGNTHVSEIPHLIRISRGSGHRLKPFRSSGVPICYINYSIRVFLECYFSKKWY